MRNRLLIFFVCFLSALVARSWIVPADKSTSSPKETSAANTRTAATAEQVRQVPKMAHITHQTFSSEHQLRLDSSQPSIEPVRKKIHTDSAHTDRLVPAGNKSTSDSNLLDDRLGINRSGLYVENQRPIDVENNFVNRHDEHTSTESLLTAALDDAFGESSGQVEISFNYTPLPEIQFLANPSSIGPFTIAYAHLRQSSNCVSCILKWQHLNSDQIEILSIESLLANELKTVFVTPANGWQIGTYVFTVYDSAFSNVVVGRSFLEIIEISSELPETITPVQYIQSLLDNGLAKAKTN